MPLKQANYRMMTVILPIMMIIAPIRQGQTGTFPSWVMGKVLALGCLLLS